MLAVVVTFSLAFHLKQDAFLAMPDSCRELVLEGQHAIVTLNNNVQLQGSIARGSLVAPWLTVLHISLPERRGMYSVIILPDSLDAQAFRQLRVWLRWGVQDVVSPGGLSTVGSAEGSVSG